jgi:hypothetical protein
MFEKKAKVVEATSEDLVKINLQDAFNTFDWSLLFKDQPKGSILQFAPILNTILLIVLLFMMTKK